MLTPQEQLTCQGGQFCLQSFEKEKKPSLLFSLQGVFLVGACLATGDGIFATGSSILISGLAICSAPLTKYEPL